MPAQKVTEVQFSKDVNGKILAEPVVVEFPKYKPVGRTRAQTRALMERKGMHPAMIEMATKHMKK